MKTHFQKDYKSNMFIFVVEHELGEPELAYIALELLHDKLRANSKKWFPPVGPFYGEGGHPRGAEWHICTRSLLSLEELEMVSSLFGEIINRLARISRTYQLVAQEVSSSKSET